MAVAALPLCDTNVLSELTRPRPDPGVLDWARRESVLALSVVTVDEVFFGLSWRPHPKIHRWIESFFVTRCEVLDVTPVIARLAGEMRGRLQAMGDTRSQADMWIAATALHHGIPVVTGNVRHFARCGVAIVNPFARPPSSRKRP